MRNIALLMTFLLLMLYAHTRLVILHFFGYSYFFRHSSYFHLFLVRLSFSFYQYPDVKTTRLQTLASHLDHLLAGQRSLLVRLKQPYAGECVRVEPEFHRYDKYVLFNYWKWVWDLICCTNSIRALLTKVSFSLSLNTLLCSDLEDLFPRAIRSIKTVPRDAENAIMWRKTTVSEDELVRILLSVFMCELIGRSKRKVRP